MYFHKTNNNEIFLILNKEETIQKSLLTYGNFVHLAAKIALKFSKNSSILDIGANIGTYCIPVALGMPLAKIIAVEPQRNVFFHLCSNTLINKLLNVIPLNVAIGETKIKNSMIKVPIFDSFTEKYTGSVSLDPKFTN